MTISSRALPGSLLLLSLAVFGCGHVDYTPPGPGSPPAALEVDVDAPFDVVWQRIEALVSERGLVVVQMSRDLGQVELSFGPVPPETYAECGQIDVDARNATFTGSFAEYLGQHANGRLRGEVSVRAHRSPEPPTRVTLLVRYVLTAVTEGGRAEGQKARSGEYSMLFNSTTPATIRARDPLSRSSIERTCRSNFTLEKNALRTLQGLEAEAGS